MLLRVAKFLKCLVRFWESDPTETYQTGHGSYLGIRHRHVSDRGVCPRPLFPEYRAGREIYSPF